MQDLGSANGTTVNGQKLRVRKRVRVAAGDRIVFGSRASSEACYRLTVSTSDAEAAAMGLHL